MRQAVLYYACGGGWGHTTRTLSLARQLCRRVRGEHLIVTNSPFATGMVAAAGRWSVGLQVISERASAEAVRQQIERTADSFQPSLLVVDTFPRGVGGELVELLEGAASWAELPKVLISRPLPQAYVDQMELVPWVRRHYRAVIGCGEPSSLVETCGGFDAGPFLILGCDELPDRASAAARCGLDARRPTVLLVGTGTEEEIVEQLPLADRLRAEARRADVQFRWAWPESWGVPPGLVRDWEGQVVRHFPLVELLPAVDLVLGSAGYNLAWETRQLGIPARLWPRPRRYDDQRRRSTMELDGEFRMAALVAEVRKLSCRASERVSYANGAAIAAEWLTS